MNDKREKPKKVGIDARFYGPVGKGLGRYTKEVADRVTAMDDRHEYVIFLGRDNFDEFIPPRVGVKKVLADFRWYSAAEQVSMPRLIKKEKIDLMHFPHFNVPFFCPEEFIVTIHDLILTKFPTQRATTLSPILYRIKYAAYKRIIKRAVKKASKIIAVSRFTKDDIKKQFEVTDDKIFVTYEGVTGHLRQNKNDKDALLRYNISEPYLLYVGNAYPHKNLENLIRVFSRVRKKYGRLRLVLVGREDYFYARLKRFARQFDGSRQDVIFPGFVPDEDLAGFYRHALAYVFPSFYEGFGLPPLEAMSHGCAVVSSDKSCLPEILGEAALYFTPESNDDMYKKVVQLITNENLRQTLVTKGYEQVKKYSWDRCAKDTLNVYKSVLYHAEYDNS